MARILIIEDNPDNLELMSFLLRAFGHQPMPATDGEAGLEAAQRELPELIVCDVHLPKIDGYEVARRLKRQPALAAIPLVAVTALAMVGDRDKVLAAGFDGYLAKPIEPELFVQAIERFLRAEQRGVPQPLPGAAPGVAAAEQPPDRAAGATLLVVDDSAVNRELMRHTLESFGHRVLLADTVDAALALAGAERPDLILSDVHMARRDGLELLRETKADPRLAQLPFVFISSTMWSETERRAAMRLGATRFVLRPIEPRALVAEVAACLPQNKGGRHGDDSGR